MKFEKGDIGIIEGTIVMDDIFTVQANYYMTGEWIIK
jgi:hypothetical protein